MTLRVGGTVCRIVEVNWHERCAGLVNLRTNTRRTAFFADLDQMHARGELVLVDKRPDESLVDLLTRNDAERKLLRDLPLGHASAAQVTATVERVRWLQTLKDEGWEAAQVQGIRALDIAYLAAKHHLKERDPRTLRAWVEADRAATLVPGFDARGGRGKHRGNCEVMSMLNEIILDARAQGGAAMRPAVIRDRLETNITASNSDMPAGAPPLPMLSRSSVRRHVLAQLSAREQVEAMRGKAAARNFSESTGARHAVDVPGLIYEFDDMDSKLFCVSATSGLGWGRPFITYGVDQGTEHVVGRSFGKEARSAASAIDCVVHAVEVKPSVISAGGQVLVWDSCGFPAQAIFDNALYNNHRIVSLGVDVMDSAWTRPRRPRDKRHVEYANKCTRAWIETEPGYRGPKNDPDALKEGLGTAIWTFEELDSRHLMWLLGVHANAPMQDGLSRRQRFNEEGRLKFRPRYPTDPRRLRMLRMVPLADQLTWAKGGITYAGLAYQDEKLRHAMTLHASSMKVNVRIDPHVLEVIYVELEEGLWAEIRCLDTTYAAGMTHYQHRQILKLCKEKRISNPSLVQMRAVREELRISTSQWVRSGKVRERRKAERVGTLPASSPGEREAVHDLQIAYEQIALVEMEAGEEGYLIPDA